MLQDEEIAQELGKGGNVADLASRLVTLANEAGGRDNITALIVRIE